MLHVTLKDRAEWLLGGSSFMKERLPAVWFEQNTGALGGSGAGWLGPWRVDQTLML